LKKAIVFIIFLIMTSGTLLAVPKSKLEWQKADGISLYEVQLRNKVSMETKTFKTSDDHVWVELLFGFYEMKIIAYDDKGRLISQSDWIPLSVMKTYQPEINSMKMDKANRTTIELTGDNYFDQTTVSIAKESVPVQLQIMKGEYPKKVYLTASLEKNSKYSMSISNPGGYEAARILHVFNDDYIMLFRNEYEYKRYFSPFFVEFSPAFQQLKNSYWNDTFKSGVSNFGLFAGYHIVSWFGVTAGLDYYLYSNRHTVENEITMLHHFLIPNAGIFLCFKHKDFIPYIDASIGYSFSFLSLTTNVSDLTRDSSDLFYKYGGGLKIFVWRQLYVDPAFHYSEIRLKREILPSFNYSLGLGWYF